MPHPGKRRNQNQAAASATAHGLYEPQDEESKDSDVIQTILKEQVNSHKKITELGKTVPVQFITNAKEYITRFKEFRREIDEDVEDIVEQLRVIKQKVRD